MGFPKKGAPYLGFLFRIILRGLGGGGLVAPAQTCQAGIAINFAMNLLLQPFQMDPWLSQLWGTQNFLVLIELPVQKQRRLRPP